MKNTQLKVRSLTEFFWSLKRELGVSPGGPVLLVQASSWLTVAKIKTPWRLPLNRKDAVFPSLFAVIRDTKKRTPQLGVALISLLDKDYHVVVHRDENSANFQIVTKQTSVLGTPPVFGGAHRGRRKL